MTHAGPCKCTPTVWVPAWVGLADAAYAVRQEGRRVSPSPVAAVDVCSRRQQLQHNADHRGLRLPPRYLMITACK